MGKNGNIIPTKIRETEPFRQVPLVTNRSLDLVDLFAGQARIAKWAAAGGLNVIAMDLEYGDHMNFLKPVGLALIILMVLRLKPRVGLLCAGPQPLCHWIETVRHGNILNKRDGIALHHLPAAQGTLAYRAAPVIAVL